MNCKQVQDLLPLYAGRDLVEKRVTLVTKHVQTCAACARVADEYHQFVQWTKQVAPPVFSESVYAGIRQRVLREIETEAMAQVWWHPIASFVRPSLSWAIASVSLIALSLFAIYFVVTRRSDGQQLADKPPAKVQSETKERPNSESHRDKRASVLPSVNTGRKERSLPGVAQPQRKRFLAAGRKTVRVKSPDAISSANNVSPQPSNIPEPMLFPPRDSAASVKTLRVEIQTKDPKIRIIWFVQQETKPVIPGSKGT